MKIGSKKRLRIARKRNDECIYILNNYKKDLIYNIEIDKIKSKGNEIVINLKSLRSKFYNIAFYFKKNLNKLLKNKIFFESFSK